ncbi:MAG: hypothetical protein ACRDRT_11720, partial [Pseudonocardiaceae bacterium]
IHLCIGRSDTRSERLRERREQLDSLSVHRRMIDRHCPFEHHFFRMTQINGQTTYQRTQVSTMSSG